MLGEMHKDGIGVEQDYEAAVEWYEKSGHPFALEPLASLYEEGKGCKQDYAKAIELLQEHATHLTHVPIDSKYRGLYTDKETQIRIRELKKKLKKESG
jgi:TPR repeat protein